MHTKNISALFPALLCVYLCYGQNVAPTVTLTTPATGALFQQGQPFTLTANANDADGSIDKVEFYQDGQMVGEVSDAPFAFILDFTPPGVYNYTARAIDDKGANALSAAIKVTINAQPFAFLSSPVNNSIFHGNANLVLQARVGDTDDAVTKVEFFQNGLLVGEDSSAPYSLSLSGLQAGPYFFAVKAFDSRGGTGTSTPAAVLVNAVPTITISGPVNGSVYPMNASLDFDVAATDPDGLVKKVEFFVNNIKVGEDSIAPYAYEYTGNFFGNYTFIARATDDLGGISSSANLNFVINASPLVAITSPVTGAKFTPSSVLTLQANANDVDGSISKVEFWQNGEKLGEDNDAPFTFIVNNLSSGGYIFAVKAFDNLGYSSTSTPVAVIVNAPPNLTFNSPTKDTMIRQGTPLVVKLEAKDPDGEIIRIELFLNDVKVAEDGQVPYTFTLNNLPLGTHKLRAKAWDDVDDAKETTVLNLTVSNTTAVREVRYTELQFYPNPVQERLFLQGLSERTRIRIYDVTGRLVRETFAIQELELADLGRGGYWLITQNGQRAFFIKQ